MRLRIFCGFLFASICLQVDPSQAGCANTPWLNYEDDNSGNAYCTSNGMDVSYRVILNDMTQLMCCTQDEPNFGQAPGPPDCEYTTCLPSSQKSTCYRRETHTAKGDQLIYSFDELSRESCTTSSGAPGVYGLCCPSNATQRLLEAEFGTEPHEFPHMAKLWATMSCGSTIYNKRWLLTAAHCVVDNSKGDVGSVSGGNVVVGTNMRYEGEDLKHRYNVVRYVAHPEYTKMSTSHYKEGGLWHDIALVEVDRDIEFGEHVKSIEMAPEGFIPEEYADRAVLPGWGRTLEQTVGSMTQGSLLMHKFNQILLSEEECLRDWPSFKDKKKVMCAGGVWNGTWTQSAGKGDSGGPLICRGPSGTPVQCGVVSLGSDDDACIKDMNACDPSLYTKVADYREWISGIAGEQDPATFYKPYLYGEPVPEGKYGHQVHITSSDGKPCGGTLIAPDVVVSAAQCVVDQDGKQYRDIRVTTVVGNLGGNNGQQFGVAKLKPLPGFQRVGQPVNVAKQGIRVKITDNYYHKDLALIKLDGRASILPEDIPRLSEERPDSGTEVAWARDTQKFTQIRARDFRFLDQTDCQVRMNRLKMIDLDVTLDDDVLCGVERFSGGSQCDRELGGGVICGGGNGEPDVLCGIQIFRLCESSIPNGFINVATYKAWIEDEMKSL